MLQVKRSVVVLEEDYPLNFVTYFYEANSQDNLKIIKKNGESGSRSTLYQCQIVFCDCFFLNQKRLFPNSSVRDANLNTKYCFFS